MIERSSTELNVSLFIKVEIRKPFYFLEDMKGKHLITEYSCNCDLAFQSIDWFECFIYLFKT